MTEKASLPAERARYLPKKIPDEVILRYRPLVELEKWIAQRVDDRTDKKTFYVTLVAVVFTIFVVPVITFLLGAIMAFLSNFFGNALASAGVDAAGANAQLLWNAFLIVIGALSTAVVVHTSLPTHLALNKDGIRLLWR
ncbi:MAG: hypothetical protein K2X81_12320, partial [Candidatus Obscuribacterales bacterium]|nr:hypothetical protein [Candidatus Obscuribacterales bacterium]